MIQINLVPDIKQEFLKARRVKRMIILIAVIVSAVVLGLTSLLGIYVYGAQRTHISNLEDDISNPNDGLIAELQGIDELDKILTIQNQLNSLTGLHNDRPKADRLFAYLSKLTPKDTVLDSINISFDSDTDTPTIEINGKATSKKVVNQYVDTFKFATFTYTENEQQVDPIDAFPLVVVESLSTDAESDSKYNTSFSIVIDYDSLLFDATKDIRLSVPKLTSSVPVTESPDVGGNNQQSTEEDIDDESNQPDPDQQIFTEGGNE